ncbi:hypothetical protein A2778_02135 [Candidatus Daviesbacteria bacterium RIFCSPHIGHO2_01_FULL_40_24]|nr:MAG: hypothetical protein A2778_02135 [Candidatus Daviesbacteria bacterium RIFCSPHIGHO2_01_FULL_40_24]OGE28606.1 MAG: hypothetical protein A3C29_03315 [Candidatus Daviesbacteria bacterium RIFCSPHIGHO2_02_FULL_40_16]OGE42984.1 MAG: hypothetical protein A3A53_06725 [Candidatus Daviesbacteria bacterium RIFCSPLOWO2_01_FULL_39_23]OGE66364.1 MAG: hypothetical protein A3J16_05205 [Candidatus Daviesbacteria bacterium RIFCSPLOWO2_02_FULL_39_13]HCE31426.1 hypothetical protein [Candidatus Daviesbacteri
MTGYMLQVTGIKILALFFAILVFLYPLPFTLYPAFAATAPCDDANSIRAGYGPCPAGLSEIEQVVANVISVIVGLGFITMLVMLIFAGIKYLTSGGEPKALQAAHMTVTWALLGIFFLALAWLALQLIANLTGIDVTVFNIKALCGGTGLPFCQP